jgi:cytochrome c oxidase subunit IV
MQHPAFEEVTYHHHSDDSTFKKRVIRTTIILSIITVIELGLGLTMYALNLPDDIKRMMIKILIIGLSLAKAFYIVSIFMHLGDEIRNMILTIVIPLMLFIWFIAAFILDGQSYKNLRNRYDLHFKESTLKPSEHGKQHEPVKEPGGKE